MSTSSELLKQLAREVALVPQEEMLEVGRRNKKLFIGKLPAIPGYAETPEAKVALARSWPRCWQSHGFWLNSMPLVWFNRPKSEGTSVKARKGKKSIEKIIQDKASRKLFDTLWTPQLLKLFTSGGRKRVQSSSWK